jgi:hypothetical protein
VIGISTPIDNASNSFSSILGTAVPSNRPSAARTPQAAGVAPSRVIPSVARVPGANDTIYSTKINIVNSGPSPAILTFSYHYINADQGNASGLKTITLPPIPPGTTFEDDDFPARFITGQTYGWMLVEGDTAAVTLTCWVRTQVDPNDSSKGFKSAEVKSIRQDSVDGAAVMSASSGERLCPGAAENMQYRTNFNLVEIGGQGATVEVTVYDTDKSSKLVATREYQVAPFQYLQINRFLTDKSGAGLAFGQATDYIIHARVKGGAGKVVSFFSKIDNISRNPLILPLAPAGPPQ